MVKILINSFGILLNIIGAWIVYKNSPLNFDVIDSSGAMSGWQEQIKSTKKKNRLVKFGVYILLTGSLLQLLSNFLF